MKKIENGSVTDAKGFQASGISAGTKKSNSSDLALLFSESPCHVAASFTSNTMAAAPVSYCKKIIRRSPPLIRAVVINSGNANACTGNQGVKDVSRMAQQVATCLTIESDEVLVSSTGRIGVPLPMEKIIPGIEKAAKALSSEGGPDAAKAIMTTDKKEKMVAVTFSIGSTAITVGGIAKGAGMIFPKMKPCLPHATMLAYITTDALVEPIVLQACFQTSLETSFNRISVDGDVSTNDTALILANGVANNPIITMRTDKERIVFQEALDIVSQELAKMMVMDGEGATKFVEVQVTGAKNQREARHCAETIANSVLCKTAWFGADPGWGRILCAAGYSGVTLNPEKIALDYGDVPVVRNGIDADSSREEQQRVLAQRHFLVHIDLGISNGIFSMWTSDLSHEYIRINANYKT